MSTPNPNQPNQARGGRPMNIQPAQVQQLLQALKNEIAKAKAAGTDTPQGQQHSAKAESIKQILLNYQAQQKRAQQQQRSMSPQPGSAGGQNQGVQGNIAGQSRPNSGMMPQQGMGRGGYPPQAGAGTGGITPQTQQLAGNSGNMNMNMNGINNMNMNMNTTAAGASGSSQLPGSRDNSGTPSLPAGSITVENFNRVKARLIEFERKIQQLEASKRTVSLPEQVTQIESQITESKSNYARYQKFAFYMKSQLLGQANNGQNQPQNQQQPPSSQPPSSQSQTQPHTQNITQTPQSYNMNSQQSQQIPSHPQQNATKAVSQAQAQISGTPTQPGSQPEENAGKSASPAPQGSSQPQGSSSASPARVNSNINLQNVIKQGAPSLPISSAINVRPPVPVTMKSNNISRPTLSGGVANGIGSGLGTPAIVKLPSYEINQMGNAIPDNGGRVLTKRKLNELVQSIGADQGDGKTVIDGDVEELLLDLADEFINSVTGFSCRLAKHRKVESIDVRDVQLHLEKNWNIRIPGYAMDEIKSTRKWQPTNSYQQKISGVEISKSVNESSR